MLCLSVLVVAGLTGLCLGTSLPDAPQPQEPLCPRQHSCSFRGGSRDPRFGCSCDAACRIYGDCCLDSQYYNETEQARNIDEYECVGDDQVTHYVYMRGKCSEEWEGDDQEEEFCLKGSTLPGVTKRLPVTSTTTNLTYFNHHCAICNGEEPATLRLWHGAVMCYNFPSDSIVYKTHNIAYDIVINNGTWGIILLDSQNSSFIPCEFTPYIRKEINSLTTSCVPYTITKCNDSVAVSEGEHTLCKSYSAAVYHDILRFRNQHCAVCNGYDNNSHRCYGSRRRGPSVSPLVVIILDFTYNTDGDRYWTTTRCGAEELWDMALRRCRKILCTQGEKFSNDRCVPAHLFIPPNTTQSSNDCVKAFLEEDDFTRQADGTIYFEAHNRTYEESEYEPQEGGGVEVCWSEETSEKFSPELGWISVAGSSLSCLALVLHLIAFCLAPSLKNLSGKCLASLSLSLLASYILLNVYGETSDESQARCVAHAAAIYYFFLCSFTWMTIIAFDTWYTFRRAHTEMRVAGGNQNPRFLAYSLCGWLPPIVCMAVVVTVDQVQPQGISKNFLPRLGTGHCWFSNRKSLLVFFATPVAMLVVMNAVFFIMTSLLIGKMNSSSATPVAAKGSQRRRLYVSFVRLAVLMGVTWITIVLGGALDLVILNYISVILTSLQGVFIFVAFTCRTKVLEEVRFWSKKHLQRLMSRVSHRCRQSDPGVELQKQVNETFQQSSASLPTQSEELSTSSNVPNQSRTPPSTPSPPSC